MSSKSSGSKREKGEANNLKHKSTRINISFVQPNSDISQTELSTKDDLETKGDLPTVNMSDSDIDIMPSNRNSLVPQFRMDSSISYSMLSDRVASRINSATKAEWDKIDTNVNKANEKTVENTETDNKNMKDRVVERNTKQAASPSSSSSPQASNLKLSDPDKNTITSSTAVVKKHVESPTDVTISHSLTILNNDICPIEDVRHVYTDESSRYTQGLDLDRAVFRIDDAQFEPLISHAEDYCIESSLHSSSSSVTLRSLFEDKNFYLSPDYRSEMWYTCYFMNQQHTNYLGLDNSRRCFVISTMIQTDPDSQRKFFHLLLQTSKYSKHRRIDESYLKRNNTWFKKSNYNVVAAMKLMIPTFAYTKVWMVKDPGLSQDIRALESSRRCTTYKFGVLLCKEGQTREEEMFSNSQSSELFYNFLTLLGENIRLKGFQSYLGGLDGTYDSTGTHSIYTKWRDNEIMFHVSTMLPFCADNNQQLERKRHLGNDIVLIVFNEGNDPISTDTVSSSFIHVVVVVRPVKIEGKVMYRLAVSSKKELLPSVPVFPQNALFEHTPEFREVFLAKLINAEWASYNAKTLLSKFQRTRESMLREIEEKYKP